MQKLLRAVLTAFAVLAGGGVWFVSAQAGEISPAGVRFARELDAMGIGTKWIAGAHIDWETGLPDGRPEQSPGRHTHCSAFVASAAKRFGIYILRPPRHGQVLLANAQNEWLATEGAQEGWRPVNDEFEAQRLANLGFLVVASYRSHRDSKPGHIAIVRPSPKTEEQIAEEGPDIIQAGTVNSPSISVKAGFAGHIYAWNNDEIAYYAHPLQLERPDGL